ncbi:MAG: NirD/YgiW/YdeI family stress tolerance protein [Muribaculaceae bacterium]|nr:NirD/YgiW/YdeI family stress tolerance protein [Muribaculaceae bacterium]
MKRISIFTIGMVLAAGAANAGFVEESVTTVSNGGFVDGTQTIVTTTQVKEMRDDTPVVVKGKIVKRTGDEKYMFQDDADTIIVEIDDDDWRGVNVTPNDIVILRGDVDKGLLTTEIDVDYVELVK